MAQSRNSLSAARIIAELIEAGEIQSTNYDPDGTPPFSAAGTRFDLINGDLQTPGLFVDGATGILTARGAITATALTILESGTTTQMGAWVDPLGSYQPGVALEYTGDNAADAYSGALWFNGATGGSDEVGVGLQSRAGANALSQLAMITEGSANRGRVALVADGVTSTDAGLYLIADTSSVARIAANDGLLYGDVEVDTQFTGPGVRTSLSAGDAAGGAASLLLVHPGGVTNGTATLAASTIGLTGATTITGATDVIGALRIRGALVPSYLGIATATTSGSTTTQVTFGPTLTFTLPVARVVIFVGCPGIFTTSASGFVHTYFNHSTLGQIAGGDIRYQPSGAPQMKPSLLGYASLAAGTHTIRFVVQNWWGGAGTITYGDFQWMAAFGI